jgi:predicted component of type VI protein secretion system
LSGDSCLPSPGDVELPDPFLCLDALRTLAACLAGKGAGLAVHVSRLGSQSGERKFMRGASMERWLLAALAGQTPYDIAAAQQAILAAGLPCKYAHRLAFGK